MTATPEMAAFLNLLIERGLIVYTPSNEIRLTTRGLIAFALLMRETDLG